MKTILLCIATGQNLANLIPALQSKPDEVWILATRAMRDQAQSLKKMLDRHRIAARIEPFDDSNVTTLEQESERLALSLDGNRVVFNATGGTKLMDIRKVNYVILGGDNAGEHLLM